MKTDYRWLKSLLCFAMLVLLASCATTSIDSAITSGDVAKVEAMLKGGADVNGVTPLYNMTPLALATYSDKKDVVKFLIAKGAKVNQGDKEGLTPLHVAAQYGLRDVAEILIAQGADVNARHGPGLTPLQWAGGFVFLKKSGSTDVKGVVELLVKKQKEDADKYDASFSASLADYRKKVSSNAALPEEAHKYKVQAEGAVRAKAFRDAADLYAEALKIAPWWPAGRFNRALVLGEAGDRILATREMTRYLQLAPDAPNARAAQDKMYEWERAESQYLQYKISR